MRRAAKRVTGGLLFFILAFFSAGISTTQNASASTYYIGGGSYSPGSYFNAYLTIGGYNAIGSPVNNVHSWGPGCIQDFIGGAYRKSGLMQYGCNGAVYPVVGDHWAYFEGTFGANASSVLGYPFNASHRWGAGWAQDFNGGQVGWDIIMRGDAVGYARHIRGGMLNAYLGQGGALGWLGYPKTDEYPWPGGTRQDFVGGSIIYDYVYGASFIHPTIAEREMRFITSAQSMIGQAYQSNGNLWAGWCDRFVAVVAGRSSSGYANAYIHGVDLNTRGALHRGDWNIPPGTLVFFMPAAVNGWMGHVGVYVGDGKMISAKWDGAQVSTLNQDWFGPYWGWSFFNGEWG